MDALAKPRHNVGRYDFVRPTSRFGLTEKRLNKLMAFFVHGYLTTGMLRALTDPQLEKETISKELKNLKRHGYIEQNNDRLKEAEDPLHSDLIYRITEHGVDSLVIKGFIPPEDAVLWEKIRAYPRKGDYWHDVATSLFTASIELGTRALGVRFISLYGLLRNAPEETLALPNPIKMPFEQSYFIPDAIFAIRDHDLFPFAVEMDMGTEQVANAQSKTNLAKSRATLVKKYQAYRNMWAKNIHTKQLGLPFLKLLIPTILPSRTRTIRKDFLAEMNNDHLLSGPGPIFIRSVPSLNRKIYQPFRCDGSMLLDEWERLSKEPTVIFKTKTAA
jgi:Replication-relaxation